MGAFFELRALGHLGEQGARVLYDVTRSVIDAGGYPPPGGGSWTTDRIQATAHEFLTADIAVTRKRMGVLMLRAHDDESMRRLLYRFVQNFLRTRSRRSEQGVIQDRFRGAAKTDERFTEIATPAGKALALTPDAGKDAWHGRVSDLFPVAHAVPIRVKRWRSERRRDPEADDASFRRVLHAVLAAAQAPVLVRDLIDVFADRFALYAAPLEVDLEDEPGDSSDQDPGDAVVEDLAVQDVWDQLSDEERRVLATYGPVRAMGEALGKGKSQTQVMRQRVENLLGQLVGRGPDAEAIIQRLHDRAVRWHERADERPG